MSSLSGRTSRCVYCNAPVTWASSARLAFPLPYDPASGAEATIEIPEAGGLALTVPPGEGTHRPHDCRRHFGDDHA